MRGYLHKGGLTLHPVRIVHLVGQIGFKPGASTDSSICIRLKTTAHFGELGTGISSHFTVRITILVPSLMVRSARVLHLGMHCVFVCLSLLARKSKTMI